MKSVPSKRLQYFWHFEWIWIYCHFKMCPFCAEMRVKFVWIMRYHCLSSISKVVDGFFFVIFVLSLVTFRKWTHINDLFCEWVEFSAQNNFSHQNRFATKSIFASIAADSCKLQIHMLIAHRNEFRRKKAQRFTCRFQMIT